VINKMSPGDRCEYIDLRPKFPHYRTVSIDVLCTRTVAEAGVAKYVLYLVPFGKAQWICSHLRLHLEHGR